MNMNKFIGLSTPFILAFSQSVFAATVTCNSSPILNFDRASATINTINYTETMTNTSSVGGLTACNGPMAARSDFKVTEGNTNLTTTGSGSYPFGVNTNIVLNNSTANTAIQNLAKIWLSENLKLSFNLRDDINRPAVAVTELNKDYNVIPNTSQPGTITINGEEYLRANTGLVNARFSVPQTGISLINKTSPSSDIVAALNGATIRIHLGTFTFKYDNYNFPPPTNDPKVVPMELYLNLKLSFSPPTCTMSNQTVSLAAVPVSILNSSQTANQQSFNISINCIRAIPNKTLLATITDSYAQNNINTNGILKNQPSLANKSNVDVQLMDDTNTPLTIGMQSSFYKVPAGSNATKFTKTLKARYFRSEAVAKLGYVQTQATVFLDYQ